MNGKIEKITKVLWKIYFWMLLVLFVGVYISLVFFAPEDMHLFMGQNIFSAIYNFVFLVLFFISLIGLRGFVYNVKYFTKEIWVFIFFMILIDLIGDTLYDFNTYDYLYYVLVLAIFVPLFYALYKYTFRMNYIWSNDND